MQFIDNNKILRLRLIIRGSIDQPRFFLLRQTQQILVTLLFFSLHFINYLVKMCNGKQICNVKNCVKAHLTEWTEWKLLIFAACAGSVCNASVFVIRFDLG